MTCTISKLLQNTKIYDHLLKYTELELQIFGLRET